MLELALIFLGRRVPVLASVAVRVRLVLVCAGAYLAVLATLTWQALRGQYVVHPGLTTIGATFGVAVLTAAAGGLVLAVGSRRATQPLNAQRALWEIW